jgi:CDP-6-deoxy-D-xylo-4-hexulose-3-dehydrase
MENNKEIDSIVEKFIGDLGENFNTLKYVYNKEFIPGESTVYYSGPYWDEVEIKEAIKTLIVGSWLSSGENVKEFEVEFCKKFKQSYGVMVNSGSSANLVMIAALKKVLKWQDNDEVILSVVGFPTTLSALMTNNLTPVFVDIEFDTLNFDLDLIQSKITDKTKAIFLSPVLGNPCDIDKLLKICKTNNIELILDNCDSLGTTWKGKYLNEYAIASSNSFYPAHHISTGEGGLVFSDNPRIVKTARSIAWWGRDCTCIGSENILKNGSCNMRFNNWLKDDPDKIIDHKYYFVNVGYNLKPLDLQGSIGKVQLTKFDEIHHNRILSKDRIQSIFEKYLDGHVTFPTTLDDAETSWFGTPIICEDYSTKQDLVTYLEDNKIQTRNYFAGNILLHPAYSDLDDFKLYPNANKVLDRVFFVGASPHYTEETFIYIEDVIKKYALKKYSI